MGEPPRLEIRESRADRRPGSDLLAAMASELDALYRRLPGNLDSLPATPGQMSPPEGCFIVIESGGEPVACGGVKRLDGETGEIKRMYVVPEIRGRGVGRALLAELERRCRELGYGTVRLDTGPDQPGAKALYESAGYRTIADYNSNPYARFWFEKKLGADVAA